MSKCTSVHTEGTPAYQRLKILEVLADNDLTQPEILAALLKKPYRNRPTAALLKKRMTELHEEYRFVEMLAKTKDKNGQSRFVYCITQEGLDAIQVPILCEKPTTAA